MQNPNPVTLSIGGAVSPHSKSECAPYVGDVLDQCHVRRFDFSRAFAVVVSGAPWNPCGHMLLNTGGFGGWYAHVDGFFQRPLVMGELGYRRYLRENFKVELRRWPVHVRYPGVALRRFEELTTKHWLWLGLAHNCAAFVEDVVAAGGAEEGLWTNCPSRETFR